MDSVKLVVGDKFLGMPKAMGGILPATKYQRCTVRFYRNVFSVAPRSRVKLMTKILKTIHAQKSRTAARAKAKAVAQELRSMELQAADRKEVGVEGLFLLRYSR
ncbi:MAG TPA: transposase [Candidatus Onthovicinus excrementipullorum]|nr:transposase [Candidatus Onthovicinus excrementipullorum]